jgi:hypothetical protein
LATTIALAFSLALTLVRRLIPAALTPLLLLLLLLSTAGCRIPYLLATLGALFGCLVRSVLCKCSVSHYKPEAQQYQYQGAFG